MTTGPLRILVAAAATLAAMTMPSCISEPHEDPAETTLVDVGDSAPDFEVEMTDGSMVTLSDLRGEVVILTFWSADCPMCQAEMGAAQQAVVDRIEGRRITYLAIARDGEHDAIVEFCRQNGCDFAVGLDPERAIYTLYATAYVPRTFIIDRDGIVRASYVEYDTDRLDEIVSTAESL